MFDKLIKDYKARKQAKKRQSEADRLMVEMRASREAKEAKVNDLMNELQKAMLSPDLTVADMELIQQGVSLASELLKENVQ